MAQAQMQQPVPKQASVAQGKSPMVEDVGEKKSKLWLWIIIALVVIGVAGLIWWLV